ncbi:hypothetical protein KKC08_05300 [Patescibacteria group bacterium]|nr:hypothetical protein [Patescibacteria group bacterium]MCG2702216.1 hypothetical protein [Candidatus Parcubacteria bacterium]MBU4209998.1 hypothetical protein [Patescibacteria group bacterium]MBU4264770.1 hypothetical protein [Patescibacteria group bacterium]MBU4390108.1 hypothetical protein [Patescibacteria group bacterium]
MPVDFAEAVVLRGIEQMYQELPVPKWVKALIRADLEDENQLKQITQAIDQELGSGVVGQIIHEFLSYEKYQRYCFDENEKKKEDVKLMELLIKNESKKDIKALLIRYQDHLQSLGLGKDNIVRFSDWLEDPEFFDKEKKAKLLRESSKKFGWEKDKNVRNLDDVNGYYQNLLKTADEEEIRELLKEQTRFQKTMMIMIVDEMRINYGGWEGLCCWLGLLWH